MKLADISIKRPVFITMVIMAFVVLGLYSYMKLNVDLYPDVDVPVVTITTVLKGAGPEQIESEVTKKIEDAVNSVEGLDKLSSKSQEGVSIIIVQFKLEADGKKAAQDIREKINSIRGDLPTDIDDPIIQRYDPASLPILQLTISGERSLKDITTYSKDYVKKALENVTGVGNIEIVGGFEREVKIQCDLDKLKAYNLSINDVINAVGQSNVEIPGGNVKKGDRQILLRTMGKFETVDAFNTTIIKSPNGTPIYLRDVAEVIDGVEEQTSLTRSNGKIAVGLNIQKQSGANTIQVADEVKKALDKLMVDMPKDMKIQIAKDNSTFIKDSFHDVIFDLIYGALLAVIVIYLFLANSKATLISALALPTSIITSFLMMYMLNFTLNMMTMLALSLAVGLLIDDAIVVIENIYRHLSLGKSPLEAAKDATEEIGIAVLATTLTIVAVFVPVAFMPGIVGRFFYQFGLTVSVAVMVSLFVAFTLTPMLSSKWLKEEDEELKPEGSILKKGLYYFNHFFEIFSAKYKTAITWSLNHRKTVLFGAIGIFFLSFVLMKFVGSEFFPEMSQGEFSLVVESDPGSSLEKTSKICEEIEKRARKYSDVKTIITTIGSNNDPVTKATIFIKTYEKKKCKYKLNELISLLREDTKSISGCVINALKSAGPGSNDKPLIISVRGENLGELQKISGKVEKILKSTPNVVDVKSSYESSKPELRIEINREKANALGINPTNVAATVRTMVDGSVSTKFKDKDEQIDVRVQLKEDQRQDYDRIQELLLTGNDGITVPLKEIARIYESSGASKINRYQKEKEIRIDANLDGRPLGDVVNDIKPQLDKFSLPQGYKVTIVGMGEMQSDSMKDILMSLMLAILFVYMVLAAQFESFKHPFTIMFSMPMAMIGAVLALIAFRSTLSVMSMIGIIMLMGLVVKNGILLVDYANQLMEKGQKMKEALANAGSTRLRPILMTSFAMIFGMIPIAFASGEGSEFRAPLGQAVIGGVLTSTFLTLFIVPVVYTFFEDINVEMFKKYLGINMIKKMIGK